MMSRKQAILVVLVLLVAFGPPAGAQVVSGTIVGTVRDTSGGTVPGATITITNLDQNLVVRTLKSDAQGSYSATLLPVGRYTVTAEATNFKRSVQTGIGLDVNETLTVNLTLEVGAATQTVTVEALPLQVDQQSAQSQTVINGTQIRELAINTRNYEQLVALMPGVSTGLASDQLYVGVSNPVGTSNQINFSVNGGRPTQNQWSLDGADNVDRGANLTLLAYPSVDSLEEFSVQRGQYGAEYGRSSSGQINVITKSGTNAFHGDLYEFFRNDVLAANNFLLNRAGTSRPPLRYNDFGGTVGGPVYIPGLYNGDKNKTFFFFSEEARRVITYTAFDAIVPTANERKGIFPQAVCFVPLNSSGSCPAGQSGTQVPSIDPAAQAYLTDLFNKLPPPNDPTCTSGCDVTTTGRNIFNLHQEIVRIDQVFNPKFTLFGRFENDTIPTIEPGGLFTGSALPGVSTTNTNSPGRIFTIHATNTFTPSLVNDVGYNYSHGGVVSDPVGTEASKNSPDVIKAIALPSKVTLTRVPDLSFGNFDSVVGFGQYRDFNDNHNFFDNLTKTLGRHTLKFGFAFNHYQKDENAGNGNQGSFSFSSLDPTGANTEFQEFANFLEGNVGNFTQTSQDFRAVIRQNEFEIYGQDSFHFRPNLTITYGVRWSLFRQPTDANGNLTNFDPGAFKLTAAQQIDPCSGNLGIQTGTCTNPNVLPPTGDPLDGIIIGGKNSRFGDAIARQDNKDFGPRIGIAWDPFKTGKTSVRAGYGIYFDSPAVSWYETAVFNNPPFVTSNNIVNTRLEAPAGASVQSFGPPVLTGVDTNWHQPYVQEWSLDIQREVLPRLLVDVGYYGNKGTHLLGDVDINEPPIGLAATALAPFVSGPVLPITSFGVTEQLNFIRPFRGYDAMNIFSTEFTSNYNALQVAVQKRFGASSLLNVNYTWSHALTDAQSDFTTPIVTSDPHLDYGPAQFDRRQIFNANWVYYLPFFASQSGLVGHALGGWEFSGIVSATSGLPLTIFDFTHDPAGIGVLGFSPATERPDQVVNPNSNAPHTFGQWFNKGDFVQVPAGQIRPGNSPRGALLGPGVQRWDLSLFKNTKISERFRLQFRAEATNVFNHTNFNRIRTTFATGTFGRVRDTRDPRIMQLALKLYF
jgi:hypothetical protein